jgi:hypothetical protein
MVSKKVVQALFHGGLLLMSLWIIWESYGISLGHLSDPGPGFLSFYTGLFLGGLCLINLRRILKSPDLQQPAFSGNRNLRRLGWAILVMAVTISLFEPFGYVITMSIFMIAILILVCQEPWRKTLIITVCTVASSYILFSLLQTQLPVGPFGF